MTRKSQLQMSEPLSVQFKSAEAVDTPERPAQKVYKAIAIERKNGYWMLVTLDIQGDRVLSRDESQEDVKASIWNKALRILWP